MRHIAVAVIISGLVRGLSCVNVPMFCSSNEVG